MKSMPERAALIQMPSKVLIIDDDPMLRRLLGAHLTTAGHDVIEVSSGIEGLNVLRDRGARIAFIDYDMPGLNGIEICRKIRRDTSLPFTHVVILTAHIDRSLIIASLDAGANDFMSKPFHRGELLARLRAGERNVQIQDQAAAAGLLQEKFKRLHGSLTAMQGALKAAEQNTPNPADTLKAINEMLEIVDGNPSVTPDMTRALQV
jgi:DNA-binding response OmpR family regulator